MNKPITAKYCNPIHLQKQKAPELQVLRETHPPAAKPDLGFAPPNIELNLQIFATN